MPADPNAGMMQPTDDSGAMPDYGSAAPSYTPAPAPEYYDAPADLDHGDVADDLSNDDSADDPTDTLGLRRRMSMPLKISGPALCGFADFFDDLGSHVNSMVGFSMPRPRKSAGHSSPSHQVSIANAKAAGKKATRAGKALKKALAKSSTRVKVSPLAAVHGVIGAAIVHSSLAHSSARGATVARGSSHARAQAKFSVAQLQKIANAALHAGETATKGADQHGKFIKELTSAQKAGVRNLQSKLSPTSTSIQGAFGRSVILGDGGSVPSPDAGAASGPLDPSLDPAQNYGLGEPPTSPPPLVPGMDYAPDPTPGKDGYQDFTVYSGLPNGAVVFDGVTHPPQHMDIGSYVAFWGPMTGAADQRGEGVGPDRPGAETSWQGGFRLHNDGWWYNWNGDNQKGSDVGNLQKMGSSPHHWGPLVGNPAQGLRGLRYDISGNQFFWFRDAAPAWATGNDDQARLNQAILDYKAAYAAAAANAAQVAAQNLLDQKTAAEVARASTAEDQAHQLDMQKAADQAETQQAQLDQQQAAFDQQMAQQQTKQSADLDYQQGQLDLRTQEAALTAPASDGGAASDDMASPEQASDDEAAQIESDQDESLGALQPLDQLRKPEVVGALQPLDQLRKPEVVGALQPLDQLVRQQTMQDEMAVDGAGDVLGIDEWGNVVD